MRLGRVKKVQLSDSVQGYKSPLRVTKRADSSSNEAAVAATSYSDELDFQPSSGNSENWMVLSVNGEKPAPRFNVTGFSSSH
jgi:hypothetical protein